MGAPHESEMSNLFQNCKLDNFGFVMTLCKIFTHHKDIHENDFSKRLLKIIKRLFFVFRFEKLFGLISLINKENSHNGLNANLSGMQFCYGINNSHF